MRRELLLTLSPSLGVHVRTKAERYILAMRNESPIHALQPNGLPYPKQLLCLWSVMSILLREIALL